MKPFQGISSAALKLARETREKVTSYERWKQCQKVIKFCRINDKRREKIFFRLGSKRNVFLGFVSASSEAEKLRHWKMRFFCIERDPQFVIYSRRGQTVITARGRALRSNPTRQKRLKLHKMLCLSSLHSRFSERWGFMSSLRSIRTRTFISHFSPVSIIRLINVNNLIWRESNHWKIVQNPLTLSTLVRVAIAIIRLDGL